MLDVVGQPISLSLAFIAGLLGSAHCIGMCGALVSGFFMKFGGGISRGPLPYLAYHLARISIYTLVGIAAASLGMAVVSTGIMGAAQGLLQIVIGLLVVLIGLDILGMAPWRISVSFLRNICARLLRPPPAVDRSRARPWAAPSTVSCPVRSPLPLR